jgi:serine/threonine protein kinase
MQNLKNFIRHGKQARQNDAPSGTSDRQRQSGQANRDRYRQDVGISEPNMHAHPPPAAHGGDFSVAPGNNKNVAARAGDVAARAAGEYQKVHERKDRKQEYDPSVLERIVAEERESRGKLPNYPGLERWILVEKMGDGAFSNVYRAKDSTGKHADVAVKVVRKFEMNSTQRANILKEVQIMRQLDHPNIVKLVDFNESKQYYYLILELCPGGELFHQIVRLTYFSENLSRHVIVQVANALEYLHETAGVVHRDIKPENLLFYPIPFIPTKNPKPKATDEEDKEDEGEFIKGVGSGGMGVIKLADFGLSKVIWDSQTMTPCGTVGYTAPEIVKDERYSKSVDMWALGCVLYTLLCGFPPFYDESIQTLTEKVARGQYTFLSPWWDEISKSAQDLVSHLLTVDPDKRYDIKQFLNHPWIRESQETTYAALDAPPLATPLIQRTDQAGHQQQAQNPYLHSLLDTPGGSRRMDFRSPGAVNLREVFDVGYAVHRQEEEAKRRKNFGQGYRGGLNSLAEDDFDDEADGEDARHGQTVAMSEPYDGSSRHPPAKAPRNADVSSVEQKMRNTTLNAAAQARNVAAATGGQRGTGAGASAAKRQTGARNTRGPRTGGLFELSLDNASLLEKRSKRDPGAPRGPREQMVMQ